MQLTLHEIASVVGAKNRLDLLPDQTVGKIEFDSRKIQSGDLFLPLKGARDGHDFIPQAFDQGALATLSERPVDYPHLLVDDALAAFQALAQYYLKKSQVEVIAVTGSNGKTTTKDMIAGLLSTSFATYKTQGNYNNEIGLPYTVLHMPEGTEKLVLEMGQDHMGDIHLLSELAQPSVGVVTLIGEAHLEFFGSREKIAQGKLQLADGMVQNSLLLLPNDPILDAFLPEGFDLHRFGPGAELDVQDLVESKDRLDFRLPFLEQVVHLPVTGKYNATNAMLAAFVAQSLGVTEDKIHQAFASLSLTRNRTEWLKAENGADILSDVYNANPTAMRLILETFSTIPANEGGKKIAVLADMKELGPDSVALHAGLITALSPEALDTLVFYGQDIAELAQLASQIFPLGHVYYFQKTEGEDQYTAMLERITQILGPKDQILLKGSNSMGLDRVIQALTES